MMICAICGHENADGKFCEKCGAKLGSEVEETAAIHPDETQEIQRAEEAPVLTEDPQTVQQETAAGNPQNVFTAPPPPQASSTGTAEGEPSQPNPYLESAKQNSKVYFEYFVKGLKSPLAVAQKTGSEQLLNGIISMVIFVILIPLMIYLSLGSDVRNFYSGGLLVNVVLKPVFWLALFMLLVAVYTFGAVKLSTNPRADLKEIIARFGTLLIPFIVISLIAFLFMLMGSVIGGLFLAIALIGGIFTIPVLITLSYNRSGVGGIDTLYAILMIYAAVFLTTLVLGDSLGSMLRPTNFFGF